MIKVSTPLQAEMHTLAEAQIRLNLQLDRTAAGQAPDFNFHVQAELPGLGITAIYGASGSGKTTLLRCIAGLQGNVQGSLSIKGETWLGDGVSRPAHQRSVGYVFQEANLFPHLSAGDNLRYASRRAERHASAISESHLLEMLGIQHLLNRMPQELSGGERQRVAIARALLVNPQLLLMDEPLASLDAPRKKEILPYLEALHHELALPVLYVTHSLEEVARLADYLLVLDQGRVREQGPVMEVMARVDSALQQEEGNGAIVIGRIVERDATWHQVRVEFPGGSLWVSDSGDEIGAELRLRILARDVSLSLVDNSQSSIVNRLPCRVTSIADDRDQSMALIGLQANQTSEASGENKQRMSDMIARVSRRSLHELTLQPGMAVWAQIKSVAILR